MRLLVPLLALTALAPPAFADHGAPGGVGGGGITVIGPDVLEKGRGALGFRLILTRPDQRSEAELEALAADHVHAHNTDYNLNAALGAAFGMTGRLTVSAELPYLRRDRLREGEHAHIGGTAVNEVVQLGDVEGVGDLNLLAKYRLARGASGGFALLAGVKAPTGGTHQHDLEGERLETEHQPGTGSWDPVLGAAAGMTRGSLQVSASALYQFSGKGAQHTRLGDRGQVGVALSHRFGPAEHEHGEAAHHEHDEAAHHDHEDGDHDHAAPHGHQSWDAFVEMTGEWEGRQNVDGEIEPESGGRSLWLSPGARFNSASGFTVAAAAGLLVWQHIRASHPDNDYRFVLSAGHRF